jgi:hypothetical protein
MGTTRKMLHDYAAAETYFKEAQGLFRKTKDPRGLIYCRLGFGELAMLRGKPKTAEQYFRKSIAEAKEYGFSVELCHASMLLSYLAGKKKTVCYNTLGIKAGYTEAPFNIP